MKKLIALIAVVLVSQVGCKKQMQDFGIVPEDKPEVLESWIQDFAGTATVGTFTLNAKPAQAISNVKAFACVTRQNYGDFYDPSTREHLRSDGLFLCGDEGYDVAHDLRYKLPVFTEFQPALTTPYAIWNYSNPNLQVVFNNLPPVYPANYYVKALPQ